MTKPVAVINQFTARAHAGPDIGEYSTNCQIKIAMSRTKHFYEKNIFMKKTFL